MTHVSQQLPHGAHRRRKSFFVTWSKARTRLITRCSRARFYFSLIFRRLYKRFLQFNWPVEQPISPWVGRQIASIVRYKSITITLTTEQKFSTQLIFYEPELCNVAAGVWTGRKKWDELGDPELIAINFLVPVPSVPPPTKKNWPIFMWSKSCTDHVSAASCVSARPIAWQLLLSLAHFFL